MLIGLVVLRGPGAVAVVVALLHGLIVCRGRAGHAGRLILDRELAGPLLLGDVRLQDLGPRLALDDLDHVDRLGVRLGRLGLRRVHELALDDLRLASQVAHASPPNDASYSVSHCFCSSIRG